MAEIYIYISQAALGEYLKKLTYEALSKENDKIFMSFNDLELLVNDLLEQFIIEENWKMLGNK